MANTPLIGSEQARATLRTGMEVATKAGDAHAREEMGTLLESME